MVNTQFQTPILFLIFNRPDTTERVFAEIRKRQPKYLFVAADGYRENKPGEKDKCDLARKIVIENVDWDCELKILFRERNLGCKNAVEGALDWFFSNVDEGIILEDDVLPNNGFFNFCSVLLERYRDDEKVFSINGCSLGYQNDQNDYALTSYFFMWGWATWKRSYLQVKKTWSLFLANPNIVYDSTMKMQLDLHSIWGSSQWYKLWQNYFFLTSTGYIDTWDYQWVYTVLKLKANCIRPSQNYIVNLGFNESGTHTIDGEHFLGNLVYGDRSSENNDFKGKAVRDFKYERDFVAKKWNGYSIFENSEFYKMLMKFRLSSLKISLRNKLKSIYTFVFLRTK